MEIPLAFGMEREQRIKAGEGWGGVFVALPHHLPDTADLNLALSECPQSGRFENFSFWLPSR